MSSVYDWSVTPGNNATADADINWSEGMFPSVVNDSARQMMARLAEYVGDNGVLTAAGTANVITLTTNAAITVPPNGMTVSFKALATNTGAVTLGLNGGAGLKLRKVSGGTTDAVDLDAGDITAKGIYVAHYDASANSNAGAWILINPTNYASLNNAATKVTPVDADAAVITDSADSGKTKRVTFANLKAFFKSYFDGLYAKISGQTFTGNVVAPSFYADNSGNAHVWFRDADQTVRGIIYSASSDRSMKISTYDSSGSQTSDITLNTDGRLTGNGATPTASGDLTPKGYVDGLFINNRFGSASLEIGDSRSSTGTAFIDFHTATSGDYDARIIAPYQGALQINCAYGIQTSNSLTSGGNLIAEGQVYSGGSGGAVLSSSGNINGTIWGGTLSTYLSTQFSTRDTNITNRILRDNASHAGFMGGDANQPYMRHGTSGSGNTIRLARYDQVAGLATAAVAAQTVGAVGTYALLSVSTSTTAGPGTLIAGSGLTYVNADGNGGSGGPSGTWRLMGRVSGTNAAGTSLFLRVS